MFVIELHHEEQCLTQAMIEQKNQVVDVAYASQTKLRDLNEIQCYSCKIFGHVENQHLLRF